MKLRLLRNLMRGEHALVVAPGPSALAVPQGYYQDRWTFGCNRAVSFCRPDFATCVEPSRDSVWPVIRAAKPTLIFTHNPRANAPRTVLIDRDLETWLPVQGTKVRLAMSPFYAAAVATYLGFDRVGLIGVDLNGGGRYENRNFAKEWEERWWQLMSAAKSLGVDIVNLNTASALDAVPKVGVDSCIHEKL